MTIENIMKITGLSEAELITIALSGYIAILLMVTFIKSTKKEKTTQGDKDGNVKL